MNAPLRRGACPTLAAPMQTGDGRLARLNPVASGLSPEDLIGLCETASRHGNGVLEITARGSFQIRGLTPASANRLAAEVDALGIAVRSGVPVETGPLAGLDPDEIADPQPLATRIREDIAAAGLEGRLGPKVSVVVDGGGRLGLDGVTADVRLTAVRDGTTIAWRVAVAADATTARPVADLAEDVAGTAVLAILAAIAALGKEGRAPKLSSQQLAAVLTTIGNVADVAPPSVLPDMSGRTEGGNVERNGSTSTLIHNTILPLTDSRFAVPVALPFGHTRAEALIEFVKASKTLGGHEIRLAPRRTLLLLCPSEASARAVRDAAARAGFITDPADPRASIAACPGSPACASGHIPARAMAAKIAASMPNGASLDLHVSGCEKRCARPGHRGLTVLGQSDGAALVLESAGASPVARVARERTVAAIGRVAALIAAERKVGESEAASLARIGGRRLGEAFAGDELAEPN